MDKVKLSPREQRFVDALPKDGTRILSVDMVEKVYPDPAKRPFTVQQSICNVASSLIKKLAHNGEAYSVGKSQREGPYPIEFWLAKRSKGNGNQSKRVSSKRG